MPASWDAAKARLYPQLWPLKKILAKQAGLPRGVVLPFCGLHGEAGEALTARASEAGSPRCGHPFGGPDLGVVVVCDFEPLGAVGAPPGGSGSAPSLETPVLSKDVAAWGAAVGDWTNALRVAVDNLRKRTLAVERVLRGGKIRCGEPLVRWL